jgi:hypothetical protein
LPVGAAHGSTPAASSVARNSYSASFSIARVRWGDRWSSEAISVIEACGRSRLALLTLYNIVTNTDAMGDLVFSVPYLELGVLLVLTIAASLLATIGPALSATRIRPAVALRLTD